VKDQRFRRAPIVHPLAHWSDLAGEGTDLPSVDASDPFLLQPTSALTRLRGAIVISQRAAYNAGRLQMRHLDAGADDCWLNVAWLHDVGGSIGGVLATLSTGGVLALSADTGAGAIGRTIERTQATFVGRASSDVLARLGERAGRGRTDVARVRAVIVTAAVLSSALLRRVEDRLGVVVKVYEHPGAPSALMTAPSDDSITKCETIGRPLPLHDVRIGRASGGTADCDEDGELLIRSLMTMDDYLGDAGGQGPVIDPEGWLHTGDLASMDERGVVRLRGAGRLS
jgi:fatty-acyl-CoA synthase